jgi:hypothetical protein
MFKTLKLTCDEATTICDKNQYGEASIKELIRLNIHLLKCRICAVYTKQNITLSNFYKEYSKTCKQLKNCMSDEDKEALRIALEKNRQ